MKHIIILGDGMADWKVPALGDKTLLQYAHTPNMDWIARMGRNGLLQTVPEGFHPGSEVANSSILGYDQHKVYEGRGPLEAASIGVELADDDLALRCNLICIEEGKIKNHSCGRLETEEADVLIRFLQEKLGNERIHFYTGVQYRHLLVIKGGNKHLHCTPPHDVPGTPFRDCMVKAEVPEAQETADLLNRLILESQRLLADHPLNIRRMKEDMMARYYDAPDLKDVGQNGYRFINAVSDYATHAKPLRTTANYKENLFARTVEGNAMIDRACELLKAA